MPLREGVREAFTDALDLHGNPSSTHAAGRRARAVVEEARLAVAELYGSDERDVVFSSGASEAALTAMTPHYRLEGRDVVLQSCLVSAIEHVCVLDGGRFSSDRVRRIGADRTGRVDLDALDTALAREGRPSLVAVMAANNETGIVQPIAEVARIVRRHGGVLVCDAVQICGRTDAAALAEHADVFIVSGHKLGGPKGTGAMICPRRRAEPAPLLVAGGQENRRRGGTEAVASIAGFGVAAAGARDHMRFAARTGALKARLEAGLRAATPDVIIVGEDVGRLSNTTLACLPGARAETMVIALDLMGMEVSAGSACSSGKVGRSHVLEAMGIAEDGVRISLHEGSSEDDIDRFVAAWAEVTGQARIRAAA